jgi:hypothetical protein
LMRPRVAGSTAVGTGKEARHTPLAGSSERNAREASIDTASRPRARRRNPL